METAIQINPLKEIVDKSGLVGSKAQAILDQFHDYFKIAAEWEERAKFIKVTDISQETDMKIARTGRLFLREKRIAIEKSRVKLKQEIVREGKAIDGIANVLKALIVPIEEYLGEQEKFAEIEAAKEAQRILAEKRVAAEKAAEEQRLKEAAERMAQLRKQQEENARLKKEAEEKEAQLVKERAEAAKKQQEFLALQLKEREEREAAEAKARAEREAIEKKAALEKAEAQERERKLKEEAGAAEKKAAQERSRLEAEREDLQRRAFAAQKEAEAKEREAVEAAKKELAQMVQCPNCNHKFNPHA